MKKAFALLLIIAAIVVLSGCNTIKAVKYPEAADFGYMDGTKEFEDWNYELRDSGHNRLAVLPFTDQELNVEEGGYYLGKGKLYSFGKAFDDFNILLTNKILFNLWTKNKLKLAKSSDVIKAICDNGLSMSELKSINTENLVKIANVGNNLGVDYILMGETIENTELSEIESKMFADNIIDTDRFAFCGIRFYVLDVKKGMLVVRNSDRFMSKTRRTTRDELSFVTKAALGLGVYAVPKEQLDKELLLDSPIKEFWLTTPMLSDEMLKKKAQAETRSAIATAAAGLAMKTLAVFAAQGAENQAEANAAARLYMTEVPIEFSWYEEDDTWRSYPTDYFMQNYGYTKKMYEAIQ